MKRIRARLLLLVLLSVGPLFLFTIYQGIEERRRAATREQVDARRLVLLFAAEHKRVVADARQILFVLAQSPAVQRADVAACTTMFRDVLAASELYGNLLLADAEGVVVASAHPGALDAEERALLVRAGASTFAVGPIRLVDPPNFPTLSVAHAVPSDGPAPRRVLLARSDMRWVAGEVAVAGLGPQPSGRRAGSGTLKDAERAGADRSVLRVH